MFESILTTPLAENMSAYTRASVNLENLNLFRK